MFRVWWSDKMLQHLDTFNQLCLLQEVMGPASTFIGPRLDPSSMVGRVLHAKAGLCLLRGRQLHIPCLVSGTWELGAGRKNTELTSLPQAPDCSEGQSSCLARRREGEGHPTQADGASWRSSHASKALL